MDIDANIARARQEAAFRKAMEQQIRKAKRLIVAVSRVSQSWTSKQATYELLMNEAYSLRDDLQHEEMVQELRQPRRQQKRA